jgi:cytochrome c-type biogenesis protein CcmH/NrfG
MVDIARLLERPGQELHVLDLVSAPGAAHDRGGAGPMLDETAKRAYKQRLQDLEEDIEEAVSRSDDARAAGLERERELLVAEISRAYGLGDRTRTAGDPVERARKAVGMRIATAIRAVAASDPDLARHLTRSIVTGRYCSYEPESDTAWRVSM